MTGDAGTALEIARALVRCPSVTPDEGGALALLERLLAPAGFACHRLPFSQAGTPDVDNLFARLGESGPHLCFAGHTDVVPPGDAALWSHPPFAAELAEGWLFGRGAVDMKGAIACFVRAALDYAAERGGRIPGSISLLITGDEEGPAINGTVKVLDWLVREGQTPDHCLLGEPSNPETLGDAIKIGRRGSLNVVLDVIGRQGHVAYPQLARNPITGLLAVLDDLLAEPLDRGTAHFEPSNLELTSIDVGNPAENVIPARASARFNIRFNDAHDGEGLERRIRGTAARALEGSGLASELSFSLSGSSFLTEPCPLVDALSGVVSEVTGRTPELSTGGGTSDARFIKDHCPVIEFGLVNTTIHQVDERVPVGELDQLTEIYRRFIGRYFEVYAAP